MKNKKSVILSAALLLITVSVFAGGTAESVPKTISVTAVGSVSAVPDMVRLNLGVQNMDTDLSRAIDDNNNRIKRIIDVIKGYGIPDSDYSTSNFSVYYQQPYNNQENEKGKYNINNNITVKLRNIEQIGTFIEDALNAGANQFYGLEYYVDDPKPLMKKARQRAVEGALQLAKETASYAGRTIGAVLHIEEMPYYGGGPVFAAEMSMDNARKGIATAPGEKNIEVQVNLEIELR